MQRKDYRHDPRLNANSAPRVARRECNQSLCCERLCRWSRTMKSKFLRQAPRRFREILRLNDFGENRQRIQISLFHSILRLKRIRPNYPNYGNIISMSSALPRPSNKSVAVVKGSPAKETMSTKTKFVLCVATVLGMASAALAMPPTSDPPRSGVDGPAPSREQRLRKRGIRFRTGSKPAHDRYILRSQSGAVQSIYLFCVSTAQSVDL